MKVYRVSPDQIESRRRRAVKIAAVVAVFTFVAPLIITELVDHRWRWFTYPPDSVEIMFLVAYVVAMGGLLVWSIFSQTRKARRDADQALSVVITVEDSCVTKRQDGGIEIKLAFPEIRRIEQYRKFLVLRTDSPGKSIVVPQSIDGYDQLKRDLMLRSAAPLVEQKQSLLWGLLGIAACLSAVGLLMLKDKLVVGIACVFIISVLAWSVLRVSRDQNVTLKIKRQSVLGLFVLASACLVRAWFVWNS
jgi:hypothetical protein